MDLATSPAPEEEFAVHDFAVLLLHAVGYTEGRGLITKKDIPFVICGENTLATTDVCIISETGIMSRSAGLFRFRYAAHRRSHHSLR